MKLTKSKLREIIKEELKRGDIHKLEGKTIKMSTILNSGTVQVHFEDGTVLEFTHNSDTKIK